jgi:2-haloacid dehalogenase
MKAKVDTIIFDLGGVLVDWNPAYLYRKIFDTPREVDYFLHHICTPEWNEEQDAGRSLQAGTELLVSRYPEYETAIRAFYSRWEEMLGGAIEGTLKILNQLHSRHPYRLLALTNWSQETFPIAEERYDFLQFFEGILVSGREGLKKPDPKIYQLLIDRYQLTPENSVFIDDNLRNVNAAQEQGLQAIHFHSPPQLKEELSKLNIL